MLYNYYQIKEMPRAEELTSFHSLMTQLPASKFGMILSLLPEIEQLRGKGHRSRAIWESLCADGLAISYDLYRLYLRRARCKVGGKQRHYPVPAAPMAGERADPRRNGADPFAGIRSSRGRQARESFDYDPLTPVKEDLLR